MENASKALLIAGGILIAMLILSIGVMLFITYSEYGNSYEQTLSTNEIMKFNSNFTEFIGRNDITVQEIVTLAQFANEQDPKVEVLYRFENVTDKDNEDIINFIKDNSFEFSGIKKEFIFSSIEYDDITGLVKKIIFTD